MLFNSLHFALFFPIVFALYWGLPHKFRVWLLLIASYYFYMSWKAKYVVLILFTTLVSYFAALLLERSHSLRTKRLILTVSLVACLGVLFVFKYFNFFAGVLVDFMDMFTIKLHPTTLKLLLPVGISFYTFQTLSYVIDVYRGTTKAEHNLGVYATFISFFPQLVAGPIERTNNLLPQIKSVHTFNYSQAVYGIKLMTWGFFKKLVIADVLAVYVDKVFSDVYSYKGFALILAVFFFTVQIYCDFSGYSDIARGCAKMLGIELMENFRSPYFAASIREYWSRWHISLSRWLRDYVYIPLGGSRVSKPRHYMNIMLTFMISGLWHGANWTYILWGTMHGAAQIVEKFFIPQKHYDPRGLKRLFSVLFTFIYCMLSRIFYRAEDITESFYIFRNIFAGISEPRFFISGLLALKDQLGVINMLSITISITVMFVYDYVSLGRDTINRITSAKSPLFRYALYFGLLTAVILFRATKQTDFVYFQF